MDHHGQTEKKISLTGSVALGTGVMFGAGIFALIGQVVGVFFIFPQKGMRLVPIESCPSQMAQQILHPLK